MFVSASTDCFPGMAGRDLLTNLIDLQFTSIELTVNETEDSWVRPSLVAADPERAINICRDTLRMDIAALNITILATGEEYYEQFTACCRLAKALKVVTLVVPAAELGTPFNEEIERLQRLVQIASLEGAIVAIKTEIGYITQDPETAVVLCNHVKGLGLALDPSHYIVGPHKGRDIEKLMPYVYHVHLRDTSEDELQVRVGQGILEYGKLIHQLEGVKYKRSLCVSMSPLPESDHKSELRKIRLLLDSLL